MTTESETTSTSTDEYADLPEGARTKLRSLEKREREFDATKAENERYKLQDSLRDAGVNLSKKQLQATIAAHEGEQTPEGLAATATELGFHTPAAAEPDTSTEEQQKHVAVQNAASGATVKTDLSSEDAYAQANTPEEVLAIARERGTPVMADYE